MGEAALQGLSGLYARQKRLKVASLFVVCALLGGCAFFHAGRESAFAVKGRIILAGQSETHSNCTLELYRRKGDQKIQEIRIDPNFEKSFVIAPGVHEYYMLVRCPGGWTYQSPIYKLGSTRYVVNPVDLGEIRLTQSDAH